MSHQWVTIGGYRLAAGRLKEVLVGQKTKKGFRYLGTARVSTAPGLRKRLSSHLRMLHIYDCPFAAGTDSLPAGLTEEQMEECVWVEPGVKAWVENLPSKGPGLCALPTVMKFTE
ncbi:hypothetical protein WJU23_18060 [Prosthecobacter sp. SYSU 5D2]|uniref:hypothetical protein n=1 Tax=Prosthecobacter sp. SYSU 5D2 TaxID=3134134 RepID=UPI0031FEB365